MRTHEFVQSNECEAKLEQLGRAIEARRHIVMRDNPPPAPWYAPRGSERFIILPIKVPSFPMGPNMQQIPRKRSDGAPPFRWSSGRRP